MSELYLPYIHDGLYESWKFIGWKKLNDTFEEANYFEELHQDNNQVWQGEITRFYYKICSPKFNSKVVGISHLNNKISNGKN
jgi:hypothetical protein